MAQPRVKPRARVEELLAPPADKPTLVTDPQARTKMAWPAKASLVLLAVFVVAATAGAGLWTVAPPAAHALLGLAVSTLVVGYLLGSD